MVTIYFLLATVMHKSNILNDIPNYILNRNNTVSLIILMHIKFTFNTNLSKIKVSVHYFWCVTFC